MAKITSEIKPNTKEIKIKISYAAKPAPVLAVYDYQLKAPDANLPIENQQGDNQNDQDDSYLLPTPIELNKGRYIFLKSNVGAIDSDTDFIIKVEIFQDGISTDTLQSEGKVTAEGEALMKIDMIKFI